MEVFGWKPWNIFAKISILDVWQGFEYAWGETFNKSQTIFHGGIHQSGWISWDKGVNIGKYEINSQFLHWLWLACCCEFKCKPTCTNTSLQHAIVTFILREVLESTDVNKAPSPLACDEISKFYLRH